MKDLTFEEAMSRLEGQVKKLESGNMSLDQSIEAFEEAIGLVKICNEKLEYAEQRVRILTETKDGSITDLPFDIDNET